MGKFVDGYWQFAGKKFTGVVALEYEVKADTPEDARAILKDIARTLSSTGVLRHNSSKGDAKLNKSRGDLTSEKE